MLYNSLVIDCNDDFIEEHFYEIYSGKNSEIHQGLPSRKGFSTISFLGCYLPGIGSTMSLFWLYG